MIRHTVVLGVMLAVGGNGLGNSMATAQTRYRVDSLIRGSEPIVPAPAIQDLVPPKEHPLAPALRWAKQQGLPAIVELKDYSARLFKRECINGKVGNYQTLLLKIRNKPFSVYARFIGPSTLEGQEVIYVEGQNRGYMWAHRPSSRMGTVSVQPDSPVAMRDQHYPLTEIGLVNLVRRLIEVAEHDIQFDECEVKFFPDAKVSGQVCTCLQVVHPVPRHHFAYYQARIYVDNQQGLPVRYESYDWPSQAGAEPPLIEEYTYVDVRVNNGFDNADFDISNPAYNFPPQSAHH
jgi:hypothetical protein